MLVQAILTIYHIVKKK